MVKHKYNFSSNYWFAKEGGGITPKKACPECGTEMIVNKHGVYVCPNCKGVYIPKSMFGVT